jgi:hypothetical protein
MLNLLDITSKIHTITIFVGQLVRLWKEAVMDYFKVLSQHIPEETWCVCVWGGGHLGQDS